MMGKKTKMIKLQSTQHWSPILDIKDGIIITKDERYVMLLEFAPINFLLRPAEDQDAIAEEFGKLVHLLPKRCQFKVISRRANVEAHIRNCRRHLETEPNENCRKMLEESILQIQRTGQRSSSKRFLVSFEYEPQPGLRRATWADIRSSLYTTASQIAYALKNDPCCNDLLSPIGDSDYVMDILYDCMARTEAEYKSLDNRIADVICSYLAENRLSENETIPVNDFLAPRQIDPYHFQHVIVDGKYYAFGLIEKKSYDMKCVPGWMAGMTNMGEGVDVDLFLEKIPIEQVNYKLTLSMKMNKLNVLHGNSTDADYLEKQDKLDSAEYIRAGLSQRQTLCYFGVFFTITAPDAKTLRKRVRWIQQDMLTSGLRLQMLNFHHDLALRATLPVCRMDPAFFRKAKRNILSRDFGTAYPFTSYEVNDAGGIPIGINAVNNSPVFLNPYNRKQYSAGNMIVLGTTGAGKTVLLQSMAMRLRQQKRRVIIIAPHKGHEYRPACNAMGGEFITIAPGSQQNINVMEIRKRKELIDDVYGRKKSEEVSILSEKINQLHTFFSFLLRDMTDVESQLLDEALVRTYGDKHITFKNRSLIDPANPSQYRPMPILGDLHEHLRQIKGAHRLASVLTRFVSGSAKSFNAQTNVNLDNDYTIIDVSKMPKSLLPLGIFIATDFSNDIIRADYSQEKAIFIDEAHRMIGVNGSSEAAAFLQELFKEVRGFNAIVVAATQDITDFFALNNGTYGKGILGNAWIKFVLRLEKEEANTLKNYLELSPVEVKRIQAFNRGEALLIANRNHAEISVEVSALEKSLITTDAEERKQILSAQRSQ